ncbi:hypothetical protein BGX21_000013 [Mortierella sp. AD011]|nr:hypothetical protein BGX20_002377 [Mortierella sp. AD010]KAF9404067.1 hypothetical protein BGX21_000013 [Mortierella sp. AD011]
MEPQHHPTNPWSFQLLEGYDPEEEERLPHSTIADMPYRRLSSDRRHYSYASSTTIAPESFEEEDKNLNEDSEPDIHFCSVSDKLTSNLDLVVQSTAVAETTATASLESHVATWREDTDTQIYASSNSNVVDSPINQTLSNSTSEDSTALRISQLHDSNSCDPAEKSISDSGVGLEGDVIEHLVQRLQSEVAETRAIVFDLESRLNAAESSNKHIVDELKVLLADAEGTLIGSDDSDSGESVAVSSKHSSGIGSDEDSNVVYNRICQALQSLITEAHSALERSTNTGSTSTATNAGTSTTLSHMGRRPCRHQSPPRLQTQGHRQLASPPELSLDDGDGEPSNLPEGSCGHSSCRTSRRSSVSHSRSEKAYFNPILSSASLTTPSTLSLALSSSSASSSSRIQAYPGANGRRSSRDVFSRMMWKEKQMEQFERYRRSCDRVSLELEMLLNDTMMDVADLSEEWEHLPQLAPAPTSISTKTTAEISAPATVQAVPSPDLPISNRNEPLARHEPIPFSEPNPVVADTNVPGRKASYDAERLQRLYKAQLLSPQVRAQQLQQRRSGYGQPRLAPMYSYQQQTPSRQSPMVPLTQRARPRTPLPTPRQFRNQRVGASRPPQSVLMQLYELWKHTWLRRRIMHALTGSLEIMLILWVILKLSETTLSWMGIHLLKGGPQTWLNYIYGDREGDGSLAAKELYQKIRKDGLQWRQIRRRKRQEREILMKEFKASEVALLGMDKDVPRTPFTSAGMIWAPAKRVLIHTVSGVVLAYLSDQVRWLAKKL